MTALRDVLYEHWSKFDSIPSYFMIDYVLAAMRRHSSQFDSAIKDIPYNNQKITRLMNIINEPYDGTRLLEYANEENFASKLSYKRPAREKIYGKQTFYGYLKSIGMNG